MGIEISLPWRKKPLPPTQPTERADDNNVQFQIPDHELDALFEDLKVPRGKSALRGVRTYSTPTRDQTINRLNAIVREYYQRHPAYRELSMGQWLYDHGVRINP